MISIATCTDQLIVTSIFGLCVKRKRMVRERDYRHAFCFLFSERQMAGVVTGRKNRYGETFEIDINLNRALKVSPQPK